MINRIKELMQVKDAIDSLVKQTSDLESSMKTQQDEARRLRDDLKSVFDENRRAVAQARKDFEAMRSWKDELDKELYEFRLFKKELRQELASRVEKELSQTKSLMAAEVAGFNDAKRRLDLKLSAVEELDSGIKRLSDIAGKIKASDFELVRHKGAVEKLEREKLELHRQIDKLQRIVAGRRR